MVCDAAKFGSDPVMSKYEATTFLGVFPFLFGPNDKLNHIFPGEIPPFL